MTTKILAETTGPFQLCDFSHGNERLPSHRPAVITSTNFFQQRVAKGQVLVLGTLKAAAKDEDFKEYLKEAAGDRQLAIDSFLAEFATNAVETEEGTSKPRPKPTQKPKDK